MWNNKSFNNNTKLLSLQDMICEMQRNVICIQNQSFGVTFAFIIFICKTLKMFQAGSFTVNEPTCDGPAP